MVLFRAVKIKDDLCILRAVQNQGLATIEEPKHYSSLAARNISLTEC